MPLSIQSNVNTVKTSAYFSKTVEIAAVASMLSDIKHHEYARPICEKILGMLSQESLKTLELFSELPFQGLEVIELILDSRCYDSVERLNERIMGYSNEYFLYYITGETFEFERIKMMMESRKRFPACLNDLPWVVRGNLAVFETILYDTDSFKHRVTNLLKELDNEYVNSILEKQRSQYESAVNGLLSRLRDQSAVEVASLVLNKRVEEDPQIKEYIFVPSFFISPHYLLAFNKYARMILFDIRTDEREKRIKEGEQLAEKLKAISDKTRLELLRLIILQPAYGKLLSSRLKLTTATISHHLEQLKAYNLVTESKSKNTKFFSADTAEIDKLLTGLKNYLYNK